MPNKNLVQDVNRYSKPSDLKITDMRFVDITDAPMHCTLLKLYTNQGLVGFGEVRDNGSKRFAQLLKPRILGMNPCNIDKIFRRIKQFGGPARQGGGVSGIEIALWDLAGKAYNVPVYQMLGGKFRDKVRIYCDTDADEKDNGKKMGEALKNRLNKGYTFLKMDLGIDQLIDKEGTLTAPLGFLDEFKKANKKLENFSGNKDSVEYREIYNNWYNLNSVAHSFTGIRITQKGLEILDQYVNDVRSIIGYEVPLAIDHIGHIGVDDGIKLVKKMEKYNLAWVEDLVPWYNTDDYHRITNSTTTPICTGEDIYLKEKFKPLLENHALNIIHPDILTSGGILENKKIGDMAQEYNIAMAVHMAESPIAAMAAVHSVAATENFLALEYHSEDVDWWDDIVEFSNKPIVNDGYIKVLDEPGLGIKGLNDEVIKNHIHPDIQGLWEPTTEYNVLWSNDRSWS